MQIHLNTNAIDDTLAATAFHFEQKKNIYQANSRILKSKA
jgi:hypothetical protein